MDKIKFKIINTNDDKLISLIAKWYKEEWNIDEENTIMKLDRITKSSNEFQVMMFNNNVPIGTAGIYQSVGIHKHFENLLKYPNWLALVYIIQNERRKGYGEMMCKNIEEIAAEKNMKELHLFTDTAEKLYRRMNWIKLDTLKHLDRNLVIMKKLIIADMQKVYEE